MKFSPLSFLLPYSLAQTLSSASDSQTLSAYALPLMGKAFLSTIQCNGQNYSFIYVPIPIFLPIKHDPKSTKAKDLIFSPLIRLGNFDRPHLRPINTDPVQFFRGDSVQRSFLELSEHLGNRKVKTRAN